jgi:hypothetical protein
MLKPTTQDKALEPESRLPLALIIGGTGLQGSGCIQDLIVSNRVRLRTTSRNARSKVRMFDFPVKRSFPYVLANSTGIFFDRQHWLLPPTVLSFMKVVCLTVPS